MKRIKIIFVFVILIIIEIGFALLLFIQYQGESDLHHSIWDFLLKNSRYLSFIPITFGITGPLVKRSIGWIFTATVFYLLIITGAAIGVKDGLNSFYELSTYSLFMSVLILSLIVMNSKDFKLYYEIGTTKVLWKENIVSIAAMLILGILLITLNG